MYPGAMALTLTPCAASSLANALVSPATACLLAVYPGTRTPPWNESIEATLMILPLPWATKRRGGGLRQVEHGVQVDRQHVVPVRGLMFQQRCAPDDPRIVDQDVDAPEGVDDGLDRLVELARGRLSIRSSSMGCTRRPRSLIRWAVSLASAAVDQREVGARLGQGDRRALAQPAGRAGDDGDFAVEAE